VVDRFFIYENIHSIYLTQEYLVLRYSQYMKMDNQNFWQAFYFGFFGPFSRGSFDSA